MENSIKTSNRFDTIGWGALFIWWGITGMFTMLPDGAALIGFGLILLAVNIARKIAGVGMNGFSTTVGVLVLIWGILEMLGTIMALSSELPVFAILLVVLGLIILVPALKIMRAE
jgi:hypothetical protein